MLLRELNYELVGQGDLARKRARITLRDGRAMFVWNFDWDYLIYLESDKFTDPPTIWEWISAKKAQTIINLHRPGEDHVHSQGRPKTT